MHNFYNPLTAQNSEISDMQISDQFYYSFLDLVIYCQHIHTHISIYIFWLMGDEAKENGFRFLLLINAIFIILKPLDEETTMWNSSSKKAKAKCKENRINSLSPFLTLFHSRSTNFFFVSSPLGSTI